MNDGKNLKEIRDLLYHVVEHMATKDELAAVKEDIADIRATMATKDDIAAVRAEMATKEELREGLSDLKENFGRRFDVVEDRVVVISNRLGIRWGLV